MIPYNKKLVPLARLLRKNMTKEEKHLWYDFSKKLPVNVRRQHNIHNYIVDFYVAEKKTVIEIDGRQHLTDEHIKSDMVRDQALEELGLKVIRYSNKDINSNFHAVCMDILKELDISISDLSPHPTA